MPVLPIEIGQFGGLDLRDDPQEVQHTAAIDMVNVDLDQIGRLRARSGYVKWTSAPNASRFDAVYAPARGASLLGHTADFKVHAYNASGVLLASTAALYVGAGWTTKSFATYKASSSATYTYGNQGAANNTLLRWDGATFTSPAVGYQSRHVAVQPKDNRLVLVETSESSAGCRVRFSNAGAPETFGANNYVDLQVSVITGVATYEDRLFVFGSDKFFVFYGNSVDGVGNPIFNYTTVDVGIGLESRWPACCASPRGVYFVGIDGVYLTTGGVPTKVSVGLDPLFRRSLSSYYQGFVPQTLGNVGFLQWLNDRLYLALPTGFTTYGDRVFVLDPDSGWLAWDIPVSGMAVGMVSPGGSYDQPALFFGYGTGTNDIAYLSTSATTDAGAAITAWYRTGFITPAVVSSTRRGYPWPGAEGVVREWLIDGTGTVTVKTAVNDAVTLGAGASVTLGVSPAITQGRDRRAVRGRNVSVEISGTAPWVVSRVIANTMSLRGPGTESA